MKTWKVLRAAGLVLGLAVALAACGSSNNSSSSSTTTSTSSTPTTALNQAAATTAVTQTFVAYFNGTNTDLNAKLALQQDATKYKAKFFSLYNSPAAKQNPTTAKVNSVAFPTSSACQAAVQVSTCAKVNYDLDAASSGASLLAGQTGYGVYVDGKWLVSVNTFCALAALGGSSC